MAAWAWACGYLDQVWLTHDIREDIAGEVFSEALPRAIRDAAAEAPIVEEQERCLRRMTRAPAEARRREEAAPRRLGAEVKPARAHDGRVQLRGSCHRQGGCGYELQRQSATLSDGHSAVGEFAGEAEPVCVSPGTSGMRPLAAEGLGAFLVRMTVPSSVRMTVPSVRTDRGMY